MVWQPKTIYYSSFIVHRSSFASPALQGRADHVIVDGVLNGDRRFIRLDEFALKG
jgi:hypothetical protein